MTFAGKRHTKASKAKMRSARLGKHYSDETKLKMSLAKLGAGNKG